MSTAATTRKPEITPRIAPGLDSYFAAVRDTNPFAANRVTEPSAYDVDVPAIHAASFARLVDLAARSMNAPTGTGVALLGGAGVGKSHLLSRLYRWANEPAAEGGTRACYVYLHNVLADPERLPRYVLKYVVSRLSNGGHGALFETPLFRFLDRAIRHAMAASGVTVDKIEDHLRQAVDAYLEHFARSPEARATYVTLLQFWRFARPDKADDPRRRLLAGAALAWLSGDEVDPTLAAQLGFKVNEQDPVMLGDDQEVQQVLRALVDLAHVSRQPFVLCIDQFENLDPDKIKPFSRFLHAMLDRASNLMVITSGVKQTLLEYKDERIIPEAAWDRIAQYTVELNRITAADARKILEARLERFHDPFVELEEVRLHVHRDTLYPLGRAWLEKRLADGLEFRARDILNWARDAWEDEQGRLSRNGGHDWVNGWPHSGNGDDPGPVPPVPDLNALIDAAVDRKIEEQIAQHRLQPGSLPPDAGNLAGLVESLLGECAGDALPYTFRGVERAKKKGAKLPPYDLLVHENRDPDGRAVKTGVAFVTNVGLSATASLRRLLADDTAIDHRILVTDQERRPLKVGAQGADTYRALERLGPAKFEHLKLNFEQYARLDALQGVIGMARSGDLEIESPRGTTRPVTEAEVIASHHRRDRFRQHPLLRPLLTEEPPIEPDLVETKKQLQIEPVRQYIMAQLAWRMGSTAQALAKGFIEQMPEPNASLDHVAAQFKEIARGMHTDGLVHATPHDNDLFLLLRK
jgi:hypothetical protein